MADVKKLLVIIWLLGVALLGAADSSIEEKAKTIRARYAEVERDLKDCRQVTRDLPGESAEGGQLTGWFKGPSLQKLSARFFGESGKALEEYYFSGEKLIFVFRVESRYTKPMSGVVKSRNEERFYFADGKLIRRLDAEKNDVTSSAETANRERELLASAKKYSARMENGR
jgi:hypothetical protein